MLEKECTPPAKGRKQRICFGSEVTLNRVGENWGKPQFVLQPSKKGYMCPDVQHGGGLIRTLLNSKVRVSGLKATQPKPMYVYSGWGEISLNPARIQYPSFVHWMWCRHAIRNAIRYINILHMVRDHIALFFKVASCR